MNILVLCDDYYHPAAVPKEGLGRLEGNEFHFDWIEDAREWSAERMKSYPLVVLTKSDNVSAADRSRWMTETVQAAFGEYVAEGHGLLAIHSGTAEYEGAVVLRGVLGGVFMHHPEQCPVTMEPKEGHALTAGVTRFTERDEHYFMQMDDPGVDVFLTTRSTQGEQPGGWMRLVGKGRVAVLTPGHTREVWLNPAFQTLVRNCLRWCGSEKI